MLLLAISLASCKYNRHLSEEEYLLWDNEIKLSTGKKPAGEAYSILKQQPNSHFFIFAPNLWIYNLGNGRDSSFTTRIGQKPVILDEEKAARGARQLQNYYFNQGYFRAAASYETKVLRNSQKSKVIYHIEPGPRYFVDSISTDIQTPQIQNLYKYSSDQTLLKTGVAFNADKLDAERRRIVEILKNHGFYTFQKNYIHYEIDTVTPDKPHLLNLKLVIDQQQQKVGDSTVFKNHEQYRISEVRIRPDYDFSNPPKGMDTSVFRNYTFIYDSLQFRERYITDALHFKVGDMYQKSKTEETYSHLANYQAFNITEITYQTAGRDSSGPLLIADVKLVPVKKRTLSLETEATTTSGNYGINGFVGITNRNLFKAGEALKFEVNSGLEFQPTFTGNDNVSRTFELGTELSLEVPRFMLPINTVGLFPKRILPKTNISLRLSNIRRVEFERFTVTGAMNYQWKQGRNKTHQLNLANLTYSNLTVDRNSSFFDALDPVQQLAFQSEFISSTGYVFTFNNQYLKKNDHSYFFQFKGETAGNLLNFLQSNTGLGDIREIPASGQTEPINVNSLFGVQYYQYGRFEIDFRHYWRFRGNDQWINRMYTGYIFPYGNSRVADGEEAIRIPPFSRFFFLGGTNDLRAWQAYRAGGGTTQITDYATGENQFSIGTYKFLYSSEYRFPLISSLKGALFVDAGNIWLTGGLEDEQNGFEPDQLLNDLYVGSGFGLRFDLDYFVIRLDLGIKVRDPGLLPDRDPWVIDRIGPRNFTYNFALGYPF